MRKTVLALVVGICVAAAVPAVAHHSFAADYFEAQEISIEGAIQEFRYKNPHAIVMLSVVEADGKTAVFAAEWAGAGRLSQQGITADTLKPGDRVKITGAPGRVAADHKIHLKRIERPADGWNWLGRGRR